MEAFTAAGFLHRKGLQYHWRNSDRGSVINSDAGSENSAGLIESIDADGIVSRERLEKYRDFDGYLGNFASKRRSKVTLACRIYHLGIPRRDASFVFKSFFKRRDYNTASLTRSAVINTPG